MAKLMLYIGYAAAIIFIGLGIAILFTDLFPSINSLGGIQFKNVFGVVIILYGIYRIVMITLKKRKSDEDAE